MRASSASAVLACGGHPIGQARAARSAEAPAVPPIERHAEGSVRAGDFVFAVGRDASGLVQASFGHVGAAAGAWRTWRGGRIESLIRLDGGLYPGFAGAPVLAADGSAIG